MSTALSDAVAYEIIIVDRIEKVERFLHKITDLLGVHGMVVTAPARVVGGTRERGAP